jgi:purine-binding chemotaxis protein CheW
MKESAENRQMLVLLRLEGQRYALRLEAVDRVIRAVAVTPVPETMGFVLGLVNLAGQLLPVISLRACLGMPDRPIRPEDQFVIAGTSRLTLALVVDEVEGLSWIDGALTVAVENALPGEKSRIDRLAKIDGDIIPIYDLEHLFSHEDQERILQVKAAADVCAG